MALLFTKLLLVCVAEQFLKTLKKKDITKSGCGCFKGHQICSWFCSLWGELRLMNCRTRLKNILVLLLFSTLVFAGSNICCSATQSVMGSARRYYYGDRVPKDMNKAFKLYLKAAQSGNIEAMFIVGGMYKRGYGTPISEEESFKWLYNAALNGRSSTESEKILGQSFFSGSNVPQNYEEAIHWFERAAKGGDPEAQSELAFLYFSGNHVAQDYKKAKYWFNIAARKGYPIAQYNMGIIWYTGHGVVAVDTKKAYAWFNLSAANGYWIGGGAKNFLETILSDEELRIAQKYSIELYQDIKNVKKQVVPSLRGE